MVLSLRNIPSSVPCTPRTFLLEGGTLADLKGRYGIEARRHAIYPNLVHLKYNQLESPMDNPIVRECRGIILDEEDAWRVVAWPFKKFFNYGESHAPSIDWATARVQEKLDGSMMSMYFWDGRWHVSSSGVPDASGTIAGTHMTFADLFWKTFIKKGFKDPERACYGSTYIFELTSPYNRVVVSHPEPDLHLIGIRNIWSGSECGIRYSTAYNPVSEFSLTALDDVLATFQTMDPLKQEGYVIVDGDFNRIKVKHPGYVALHHLKSSFSVKRLVEVIRNGESAEVLVAFPEWKVPFEKVTAAYMALVTQLEQDFEALRGIENRKEFAMMAKNSFYPPIHFSLLDGHCSSVKEGLSRIHIDRLVAMLGVKDLVLEGAI